MIEKHIDISIPLLWGEERFTKNDWGYINYIVGQNQGVRSLEKEKIEHV